MKAKVIGAGSIGNHLTQACRRMGWEVSVIDRDPEALRRMKEDIYPNRYGAWDDSISLFTADNEPEGGFDIIFIGTPPDVRMKLALKALKERPKILQLEKPLCSPTLEGLNEFLDEYNNQQETVAVIGYDHAVSDSIGRILEILDANLIGEVETIDVEFREHWQGIFKAHPWLKGPQDTYLGYWKRGGGAGGEHSHALHLWQLFARRSNFGNLKSVNSAMDMRFDGGAEYDALASFNLISDRNKVGRVIQDVITLPVRKWARIQGNSGFAEWICNGHKDGDLVRFKLNEGDLIEEVFAKKRPDDFYIEMKHIDDLIKKKIDPKDSPLALDSALLVMKILNCAYENREFK